MSRRRVAVTGIGLMSALGTTREAVWDGLVDGRCGIADVTLFDVAGYRSPLAAEIPAYRRDPGVLGEGVATAVAQRSDRGDRVARSAGRFGPARCGRVRGIAWASSSDPARRT